MLTPDDHKRIEAAVAEAEAGSTGDIFCVLAGEVSTYREVPIAWGAAAALVLPPLVLAFALRPILQAMTGGWIIAEPGANRGELALIITGYAVAQALIFGVVALIASIAPVRRALTPRFLKQHRVKKAAFQHFVAAHAHAADSETGVVIFVALVERQVEVLADAAIHAKVGDAVWADAARAVQEGMKTPDPTAGIIKAISICGAALKAHFPSAAPRANVGNDRPLEV